MLNAGPRGGWGTGATTVPPNPFNTAMSQPGNPFAQSRPNPFSSNAKPNAQPTLNNPFDTSKAASTTPFNPFSTTTNSALKRSASPSSKPTANGIKPHNPFAAIKQGAPGLSNQAPRPSSAASQRRSPSPATSGSKRVTEFVQPAWPNASATSQLHPTDPNNRRGSFGSQGNKRRGSFGSQGNKRRGSFGSQGNKRRGSSDSQGNKQSGKGRSTPIHSTKKQNAAAGPASNVQTVPPNGTQNGASNSSDGRSHEFASKIRQQLAKDRIKPPQWPRNPGSHLQRQAMEAFRESYKAYREKARKSLIKAGLIDDPEQRRTLQQALDFRGISEDMCPEWEKITRIIEYDVRNPEKANDDDGDLVAVPSLMVKRLARSAAGQDAPLPMDVRSFATLRKTLDYLIDDLIPDDSLLPSKHNFLWDRTRAIRIDLSVQKYNLTPGERTDLVYCLETIARFHVTALHLLSQDGFAAEDFSEQQEIEQLGKTLISLKEVYDDCVEQGIECPNEAEFRGYYIVFNARNPSIKETVEGWGSRLWNSDGIRTAMCLVESLQNTWTLQGPLNPYAPTEIAIGAAAIFFSIVSSSQISYTMACFAEIHFNDVRKTMLQVMRRAYSRPREGPKDITPAFLKKRLRFDTEDDAVEFAEKHGIVFGQDENQRYAILNSRQSIEDPRIRHAFSQSIVEYKRSNRPLPDVIHRTVYHEPLDDGLMADPGSSLFIDNVDDTPFDMHDDLVDGNTRQNLNSKPPDPVVSTPAAETHSATQSQATAPSLFSGINGPAPTINQPVTASPFSGQSISTQKPDLQSIGTLSSQPITPSTDISSGVFNNNNNNDKQGERAGDTSSWFSKDKQAAASNGSIPPTSNGAAATSIFSSLNGNQSGSLKPAESQLKSGLGAGSSLTPTSFFSPNAASKATTAKSLGSSESSSLPAPAHSEDPKKKNPPSLFAPTPPKAAPADKGVSILGPTPTTSSQLPRPSAPTAFDIVNTPNFFASATKSWPTTTPMPETASTIPEIPKAAAPASMEPKKDPMGKFARWFVLADKGLMREQLEAFAVEHVLKTTWEKFKVDEARRIAQEEDQKSWAEALQFRNRSLKVTFFYRWLKITRKRRAVKRIRLEKEKARRWNSLEGIRQREMEAEAVKKRRAQEVKELVAERTKEHAQNVASMRESTRSRMNIEDALLATGVFSGVQDERAAARYAAQSDDIDSESDIVSAEQLKLRSENQRRRMRGLPPLKQLPEGKTYRAGSKTAMLRAISSGSGRESLSLSTGSMRNSTYSSSYRSSLGFNPNGVSKSRAHAADPYWRMKALGLVQMPNGDYLPEHIALPMLREGKRFPGIGNYGLPPVESFTPSQSPPRDADFVIPEPISPTPAKFRGENQASTSPILNGVTQKRKRGEVEDEDLVAYRNEVPASRKRAKSKDRAASPAPNSNQNLLDKIEDLLSQVNEVTSSSRLSRPGSRQTTHG